MTEFSITNKLQNREDCEIFALDESHFSTEPCLVRGYQKKGGRQRIPASVRRESRTFFGCLNLKTRKFYWKKSKQGDSDSFILFLTQLRQRFAGKTLAIKLEYSHQQEGKEIFAKVSSDSSFLSSHLFAGIHPCGENMGMDEDQDLRFFCLWRDKRIDQTFSETVLAFQYRQACQAHLLETGSLQQFVIKINAVIFIALAKQLWKG
jgi:hypothetical protein